MLSKSFGNARDSHYLGPRDWPFSPKISVAIIYPTATPGFNFLNPSMQ